MKTDAVGFFPINYDDLAERPEFDGMTKAYRAEVGHKDYLDGVLDEGFYRKAQAEGRMGIYAMQVNDALAGFFTLMFCEVPHATMLSATVESFYIAPAYRGYAKWALAMLAEAAKDRGAPGVLVTAPVGSRMDRWMQLLKKEPAYKGYYIEGPRNEQ